MLRTKIEISLLFFASHLSLLSISQRSAAKTRWKKKKPEAEKLE
jgi:hypothetical protein